VNGNNALPRGWTVAPISDVVSANATRNPAANGSGTFRYVDIEALDNRRQSITSPKDIHSREAPSRARMLIRAGDVLFSLVRPYLKNIAVVPPTLDGEVASTAFCIMHPEAEFDSRFLFYQIVQDAFINSVPTYGNSPPSARDEEFLSLTIAIAPHQEQRRIVAKIEELFSDLDAGVAALERVRANLKRYRATVLKAAVEGKLTEDWRAQHPATEPATVLLERIFTDRRRQWEQDQLAKFAEAGKQPPNGWQTKYQEPSAIDVSDLPDLPRTWCWVSVDQVADDVTVGHVGPMKERYVSEGIPFLRSQNVRPLRYEAEGLQFIPADFHNALAKSCLHGGELLVVRSGVNVGDSCVYPVGSPEANCADLVITRPAPGFHPSFGAIFVNSPTGKAALYLKRTGNAQPHFNIGAMRVMPFPFPPRAEQSEIVARVEQVLLRRQESRSGFPA
jgi:type I restriction enzyme, S subunit